jgi:hypothetical protein
MGRLATVVLVFALVVGCGREPPKSEDLAVAASYFEDKVRDAQQKMPTAPPCYWRYDAAEWLGEEIKIFNFVVVFFHPEKTKEAARYDRIGTELNAVFNQAKARAQECE